MPITIISKQEMMTLCDFWNNDIQQFTLLKIVLNISSLYMQQNKQACVVTHNRLLFPFIY